MGYIIMLEEILKYYADMATYKRTQAFQCNPGPKPIDLDKGERTRLVLKQKA